MFLIHCYFHVMTVIFKSQILGTKLQIMSVNIVFRFWGFAWCATWICQHFWNCCGCHLHWPRVRMRINKEVGCGRSLRFAAVTNGVDGPTFRNVVGKCTLHAVRKLQNQKTIFISRWKSKIKTVSMKVLLLTLLVIPFAAGLHELKEKRSCSAWTSS
jgi:hypothetical protein